MKCQNKKSNPPTIQQELFAQMSAELLSNLSEAGTMEPDSISEELEKMKKDIEILQTNNEILKQHEYGIWQGSGKDKRWRTYVHDESKKNCRRMITGATQKDVLQKIIVEFKKEAKRKAEQFLIATLFEEWIALKLADKDFTIGTADRYRNDYDRFIAGTPFAELDIRYIKEKDIIRFLKDSLNTHEITHKCFSNLKTVINGIFSYAKSEREIDCILISYVLKDFKPSAKKFKVPVVKDCEQVFTQEEVRLLVNYVDTQEETLRTLGIVLALLTGLRNGELAALKVSDYSQGKLYISRSEIKHKDETGHTIYEIGRPKTEHSMNCIIMSESAIMIWNRIMELRKAAGISSEYVFYEERFGRLKTYHFAGTIKHMCKKVNILPRSTHKLRKTYSSHLFANGVDPKVIQFQMRHSNIETTNQHYRYRMRSDEDIKKIIDQNDLLKAK